MSDDVKALIAEARTWTTGLHMDSQSEMVTSIIHRLADALEAAQQAPAVDRVKLAQILEDSMSDWEVDLYPGKDFGQAQAEAVISGGILQDASVLEREAEARGLEKAADEIAGGFRGLGNVEWIPRTALVARAQQVREGN